MADEAKKGTKFPIHPIIAKLAESGRGAVVIHGYIGPADKGICRVYRNLALSAYMEFPENAIVQAELDPDASDGRMRLVVGSSTEITVTHVTKWTGPAVRFEPDPRPPLGPRIPDQWPFDVETDDPEPIDPMNPVARCRDGCTAQHTRCVDFAVSRYLGGLLSYRQLGDALQQCAETRSMCNVRCLALDPTFADLADRFAPPRA